jgi:hypothetical protein
MRNQSHRYRTSPIELSKTATKVRVAGTHPTDRWSTSGEFRKLKVVMEIVLVLMAVATAGLMTAHGFAIVKRFIAER